MTQSIQGRERVRYSIDKGRGLIVNTAEGCVKFDDIKDHQDRLLADYKFDVSFDQLIDTTGAIRFDMSDGEARILAERPIVSPESRRAFVAIKPHIFGLGRMMEIYHESLGYADCQVFYSMDQAFNWLERQQENI